MQISKRMILAVNFNIIVRVMGYFNKMLVRLTLNWFLPGFTLFLPGFAWVLPGFTWVLPGLTCWVTGWPDSFTVWLGTVGLSVSLALTNVVATICQKKSPRTCAVVGGVICSLGVLLLSFSHKVDQLFIIYCGILSVGTGICLSTASIIVGRYFNQRRELAEMFMTCGTGAGTVVMAIAMYGLSR